MSKVKEHYSEVNKRNERINQLDSEIKDNEQRLATAEKEYKQSVIDNSDNVDDLFYEMDRLKNKIKADKHKLTTLENVTNEFALNHARDTIHSFVDVQVKYRKKLDEAMKQI